MEGHRKLESVAIRKVTCASHPESPFGASDECETALIVQSSGLRTMWSSSTSSNVLAGTASKYFLLFCNIATGIVLMPFTLSHLGAPQYGLWMLAATLTSYFQLLDIGYGNGLVRHIVDADARGDTAEVNQIISTFVCVYGGLGVIAGCGALAVIAFVVPRFPSLNGNQVRTAQALVAILSFRVAVGFPMTVFGAVTNARQGFIANNTVAAVVVLINAALTYLVLAMHGGLLQLVSMTTAVNVLAYVAYAMIARRLFPALHISWRRFSRVRWRDVTAFSVYLFVIDVAVEIVFNIDNIVIAAALGTGAVAVYAVALRLSQYQRRLSDQVSGMLFPVAASFKARGDIRAIRRTMIEGTRLTTILVVGATICLVGFAQPLVHAWMGSGFDAAIPALIALAMAGVAVVAIEPLDNVLIATGSHRFAAAVWVAEAIANLGLSLILVRRYGLTGVAIGTAAPLFIGHFAVLLPLACHRAALPLREAIPEMFGPALLGAFPAIAVCFVIRSITAPQHLAAVAVLSVPVIATYAVAVLAVGLRPGTRQSYFTHIRQLRRGGAQARCS